MSDEQEQEGFFDMVRRKTADGSLKVVDFGYYDADGWHPPNITITTTAEAEELLQTYTLEQVRTMWENGAFQHPLPPEVKDYFAQRLILGDL